MIVGCSMPCSGWPEAGQPGPTFHRDSVLTRQYTAVSANGGMTGLFCAFFRNSMRTLIWKICASTVPLSKRIRRARVQKRGCKCGKQPIYWDKPRWKDHKIHAVTDALGNPVHFLLTGGNVFDSSVATDLLGEIPISGSNILGDKAYGYNGDPQLYKRTGGILYDPAEKEYSEPLVL